MGLSMSAVSYALRNSPEVSKATRRKVQRVAREMGYVPSPAMGALAEYRRSIRSAESEGFRTLAYVHTYVPEHWRGQGNRRALLAALEERAQELGYRLEVFAAGQTRASMKKCSRVLYNRGIQGVFLAPHLYKDPGGAELQLDWEHFAAISVLNEQPSRATHLVMPSWVRNRELLLEKIVQAGVERVGVYTTVNVKSWSGEISHTFSPHRNAQGKEVQTIPPLVTDVCDNDAFIQWFHLWKPQVVVTNLENVPALLADEGLQVPQDVGVVFLDSVQIPTRTGVDVLPREVARTAVSLMNDLLRNQSLGVPEHPYRLMVPGKWQWGETWKGKESFVSRHSCPFNTERSMTNDPPSPKAMAGHANDQ